MENLLESINSYHDEYRIQLEKFNNFQEGVKAKFSSVSKAVSQLTTMTKNESTSTESGLAAIFTYYKLIRDLSYNVDSTIDRMYVLHDKTIEETDKVLEILNYLISFDNNDNDSVTLHFNPIPKGLNSNYTIDGVKAKLEPMLTVVSTTAGLTEFGIDSIRNSRTTLGKIGGGILAAGAGALTILSAWAEAMDRKEKIQEESAKIIKAIGQEQKLIKIKIRYVNKGIEKISLLNTTLSLFFSYFDSETLPKYIGILQQEGTIDEAGQQIISEFIKKMKESLSKVEAMQYSAESHPVRGKNSEDVVNQLDYLARSTDSDAQDAIQITKRLSTILESYIPTTLEEANKSVDQRRNKKLWTNILWALVIIGTVVLLIFLIKLIWPVLAFLWSIIASIFSLAIWIIKGIFSLIGEIFSMFFG